MKKYAIHPGNTMSMNDSQIHFINYDRLVRLYRVDPDECIAADNKGIWKRGKSPAELDKLVHLYPRMDGNYSLQPIIAAQRG